MNIFKKFLSCFRKKHDKNNETAYIEFFGEKLYVGGNMVQNVPPLYQRIFAILQKNSESQSLISEFKEKFLEKKRITYGDLKSLWILLIQTPQWGLALASLIFEGFGKIPIYWCNDIHPYFIDKTGSYHQKWFIRLKYELILFCIKEIQNNKEKKYKDLLSLLANKNGYKKVEDFVSDTFLRVLAERVSDRTGLTTLVYDNDHIIIQSSLEELLITLRVIIKTFPSDMELADDWALIEKFFLSSLKEGEK